MPKRMQVRQKSCGNRKNNFTIYNYIFAVVMCTFNDVTGIYSRKKNLSLLMTVGVLEQRRNAFFLSFSGNSFEAQSSHKVK